LQEEVSPIDALGVELSLECGESFKEEGWGGGVVGLDG
jgi:hypothetical protein